MIECGFITKREVRYCIHYLQCRTRHGEFEQSKRMLSFLEKDDVTLYRISYDLYGYDKKLVWERLFYINDDFMRIMTHRRISNIDSLLFRAWDYYDIDMPGHEDEYDELNFIYDDAMMKPTKVD